MDTYILAIVPIIILAIILILEFDNTSKLNKLYKLAKIRNSPIPDAKYFELKSSISLIRIILTASVFLLGFLGFNSYYDLQNSISEQIKEEYDKNNEVYTNLFDQSMKNLDNVIHMSMVMDSIVINYDTIGKHHLKVLEEKIEHFNQLILEAEIQLMELKKVNEYIRNDP